MLRKSRFVIIVISLCTVLASCSPKQKPTASNTWNVQRYVPKESQLLALFNVSDFAPSPDVCRLFLERTIEAEKLPLNEKAGRLADIGITAFFNGCYIESARALDRAIPIMGSFTSDPLLVAQIISEKGSEQERIFKGEPHERAVVFLIRGLLYLTQGDFDNARACFKAGQIQDSTIVDNKAVWGDWFSLEFLESLTNFWQDGLIPKEPASSPEGLFAEWPKENSDSILVVASGLPPAKILQSRENELYLSYERGSALPFQIELLESPKVNTILRLGNPAEDVFIQAISRGRREMDKVLEAKYRAAERADNHADTAEVIGVTAAQFGLFGLPIALGSAIVGISKRNKAVSFNAAPDMRQLSSLPTYIYIGAFQASPTMSISVHEEGYEEIFKKVFNIGKRKSNGPRLITCRLFK